MSLFMTKVQLLEVAYLKYLRKLKVDFFIWLGSTFWFSFLSMSLNKSNPEILTETFSYYSR